jgi:hypothetical protein
MAWSATVPKEQQQSQERELHGLFREGIAAIEEAERKRSVQSIWNVV